MHRGRYLQRHVHDAAVAGREVPQDPREHGARHRRSRRRADVLEAGRKRVRQDDVVHHGGARPIAVAQPVGHRLPDARQRRARELLVEPEQRNEDAGADGVRKSRIGRGSGRREQGVGAVVHRARRPGINPHLEGHGAGRPGRERAQVDGHQPDAGRHDPACVVAGRIGQGRAVPLERARHIGRAGGERVAERDAERGASARDIVVHSIGEQVAGDRRRPVHLLREAEDGRFCRNVHPVAHHVADGRIEPARGGDRDGVAHAQHPGARDRNPREQLRTPCVPQGHLTREQRVTRVQDAVSIPVAVQRHRPSVLRDGRDGKGIRAVAGVGERVRKDDRTARQPGADPRRLQVDPCYLADEERNRV